MWYTSQCCVVRGHRREHGNRSSKTTPLFLVTAYSECDDDGVGGGTAARPQRAARDAGNNSNGRHHRSLLCHVARLLLSLHGARSRWSTVDRSPSLARRVSVLARLRKLDSQPDTLCGVQRRVPASVSAHNSRFLLSLLPHRTSPTDETPRTPCWRSINFTNGINYIQLYSPTQVEKKLHI